MRQFYCETYLILGLNSPIIKYFRLWACLTVRRSYTRWIANRKGTSARSSKNEMLALSLASLDKEVACHCQVFARAKKCSPKHPWPKNHKSAWPSTYRLLHSDSSQSWILILLARASLAHPIAVEIRVQI